jgi:hypothetical protein
MRPSADPAPRSRSQLTRWRKARIRAAGDVERSSTLSRARGNVMMHSGSSISKM